MKKHLFIAILFNCGILSFLHGSDKKPNIFDFAVQLHHNEGMKLLAETQADLAKAHAAVQAEVAYLLEMQIVRQYPAVLRILELSDFDNVSRHTLAEVRTAENRGEIGTGAFRERSLEVRGYALPLAPAVDAATSAIYGLTVLGTEHSNPLLRVAALMVKGAMEKHQSPLTPTAAVPGIGSPATPSTPPSVNR